MAGFLWLWVFYFRSSGVPVDPLTESVEVLCPGALGDISERSGTEFVMEWDGNLPAVALVRRVFVVQLRVITGRPSPLESTYVHQHLHDLQSGERPLRHRHSSTSGGS